MIIGSNIFFYFLFFKINYVVVLYVNVVVLMKLLQQHDKKNKNNRTTPLSTLRKGTTGSVHPTPLLFIVVPAYRNVFFFLQEQHRAIVF